MDPYALLIIFAFGMTLGCVVGAGISWFVMKYLEGMNK